MKNLSLLYLNTDFEPCNFSSCLEDFHLNDIIFDIIKSEEKKNIILKLIKNTPVDKNTILYRQDVIVDFVKNKYVFYKLSEFVNELYIMYDELIKSKIQIRNIKRNIETPNYILNDLVFDMSDIVLKLLNLYSNLYENLYSREFNSKGLNNIKDYIKDKISSPALVKLKNIIIQIRSEDIKNYEIEINDKLEIAFSSIIYEEDNEKTKKGRVKHNLHTQINLAYMNYIAKVKLLDILEEIYYSLFEPFSLLKDELVFYEFVLKYYEIIESLGINFCFPTINQANEKSNKFLEIYDLYLLIDYYKTNNDPTKIKANSLELDNEKSGSIILGNNNTGKTVFIRSLCVSIIFGHLGLFVPAKECRINLYNAIYSFQSTEEDTDIMGGRFEQEVSKISEVIDSINSNSIIFMNEIFQTTSTQDGASALFTILDYFRKQNILWIVVTHLVDANTVFNFIDKEKINQIKLLKTTNEYQMISIN